MLLLHTSRAHNDYRSMTVLPTVAVAAVAAVDNGDSIVTADVSVRR